VRVCLLGGGLGVVGRVPLTVLEIAVEHAVVAAPFGRVAADAVGRWRGGRGRRGGVVPRARARAGVKGARGRVGDGAAGAGAGEQVGTAARGGERCAAGATPGRVVRMVVVVVVCALIGHLARLCVFCSFCRCFLA